mmetsp:Transcript_13027/g.23961  ORF Transcript_13027/g.23961 Transcript_13027/m.23961 type:complete len:165 (+) Transcript_13027:91-585(+)
MASKLNLAVLWLYILQLGTVRCESSEWSVTAESDIEGARQFLGMQPPDEDVILFFFVLPGGPEHVCGVPVKKGSKVVDLERAVTRFCTTGSSTGSTGIWLEQEGLRLDVDEVVDRLSTSAFIWIRTDNADDIIEDIKTSEAYLDISEGEGDDGDGFDADQMDGH